MIYYLVNNYYFSNFFASQSSRIKPKGDGLLPVRICCLLLFIVQSICYY